MTAQELFQQTVNETLQDIQPAILAENPEGIGDPQLFDYIAAYAAQRELVNTAIALPLVRYVIAHAAEDPNSRFGASAAHGAYFQHSMTVCRMLIDLHITLPQEDEDILLASAICHILPENITIPDLQERITEQYRLDARIAQIVSTLFWKDNSTAAHQQAYYDRVQKNKLALLVKLADRGNLVQQLYDIDGATARSHIQQTRRFFLPMCIYAKEWYPELIAPVSVMLEKMRCLMEVADILLSRYEVRETALMQEILELQEENATIRGILHANQI